MSSKSANEKYALISVFDKTGIVDFAKNLVSLGYRIISTGGTVKTLTENKIPAIPIQKITGNPESFDGRMKTISFQIESGILFDRKNKKHIKEARKLKIKPIDIVVCNFYPFEETIASKNISIDEAIENIDIGGPTMVRAAAKNFKNVIVITDPNDYIEVSEKLKDKTVSEKFKKHLSAKAFDYLSFYDSQIAKYLRTDLFPGKITIAGKKVTDLRYGENPHQKATLYLSSDSSSLGSLRKLWGRELSLINITDINAGIESVRIFDEPCAVVIKHNTPCGIALGKTPEQSLKRAIEADPESAFGGIIVMNKTLDKKSARIIAQFKDKRKGNIDVIAAPRIEKEAFSFLSKVRKSMGIYETGKLPKPSKKTLNVKWIDNGFILQTQDIYSKKDSKAWKTVTKKIPTKKQLEQLRIAWLFITKIKSNSVIVVDKNLPMTRGIGSGQTSRVKSTRIALEQAGNYARGGILASDSFFPFGDCVKLCAKYKIGAIIQRGGSVNDKESIDVANNAGIPMLFTNRRAFWH
ncbi:MAG: bifunctional phosphoribosylaminoimidazolecarboxamide formyltransferase/IMP cyclohydrolase [Candidatus Levybacteria bacterium RIFCSPLOWO2_01_FULL_38_21]|nr:MAG: bifunctional phosphoribosylaminoimidazolecarboxamide formyltransferase/IMP cyclohydrolase [Candidatus Levybacteria bacterium RIFCSPLOWO2_01_FULL_38_21]